GPHSRGVCRPGAWVGGAGSPTVHLQRHLAVGPAHPPAQLAHRCRRPACLAVHGHTAAGRACAGVTAGTGGQWATASDAGTHGLSVTHTGALAGTMAERVR